MLVCKVERPKVFTTITLFPEFCLIIFSTRLFLRCLSQKFLTPERNNFFYCMIQVIDTKDVTSYYNSLTNNLVTETQNLY